MEFEDLKRIWDSQANEALFVIDEKALHRRITAKKERGRRIITISEWLSIGANALAGIALLAMKGSTNNVFLYLLPIWMILTSIYVLVQKLKRNRNADVFDRTLRGDLDHAIQLATYQVRLSNLMRWNTIPIAILLLLSLWASGNAVWMIAGFTMFFVLAFAASRVEHNYYQRRKRELEALQGKLMQGVESN